MDSDRFIHIDGGIRVVGESETEDERANALERVTSTGLVALLFEMTRGALFVLDRSGEILSQNQAGRELVGRSGHDLVHVIARSEEAIMDTAVGLLRVTRRAVATSDNVLHLVVLAEPFAIDASELFRVSVARWQPTTRQADVLRYILEGLANKEIASRMGLSPRTIEVHVTALFDKAGVDSRARLVARARELI
jgi:DNA-binding NarL/FixJ family response regulator